MPNTPSGPETITITLPSRLELLAVLDRVALAMCEHLDFDEDTRTQISMSVIEAGTNAIQHGHKKDPTKAFDTKFEVFSDRIEITVHDTGTGFRPAEVNGDATSPEHLFDARGRGIFIMRSCMDAVEFRFGTFGTECHLVKRRAAPAT
jgi:anti-sigma regulatory factor (Ser/Thr protein kinase)